MGVKAKSLRLAMLTPEYAGPGAPDGGLANYVRNTARELVRRGHAPVVFTLAKREERRAEEGVEIRAVRQPVPIAARLSAVPAIATLRAATATLLELRSLERAFWQAHRESPFDVIHSSSYGAPAAFLTGNREVPVVCRLSSHSPTVRAAHGRATRPEDRIADWLEQRLATRAHACFAPSRLVADQFERVTGRSVSVLRTACEDNVVVPDRAFFAAHRPRNDYLLFVGTLSRIKGVDLLAQALPGLLHRHPELTVVFIGRDDRLPDGSPAFAEIARQCGARAVHLSSLDKPRLQAFLDEAVGVLMPSRVDNYPNVCLEAQAAGIPVVGTRGASLDEMIEDGVTGFLADNGDPASLAAAIERLLARSPEDRAAMRKNILATAQAARREDRVGQLVALYERTIAELGRCPTR